MKKVMIVQRSLTHYRKLLLSYVQSQGDYEITICTQGKEEKIDGNVRVFPTDSLMSYKTYRLQYSRHLIQFIKDHYQEYDYIILEGAPNIVNNLFICTFLRQHGKPYIVWDAGRRKNAAMSLPRRLAQGLLSYVWKNAAAIIAYSTLAKQYFVQIGVPEEKVFVCQNTLVVSEFDKQIAETTQESVRQIKNRFAPSGAQMILYVGAIQSRKRVKDLIDAYVILQRSCRNVSLVIIGGGEQLNEIKAYAESTGLPIYILGAIIDGVIPYFMAADVFALPSEGGLSLNQAMICAKPVLASSADGTELDLIEHGKNGYLFEETNVEELASGIQKILCDDCLKDSMGAYSRRIIDEKANEREFYCNFQKCLHSVGKEDK